MKKALTLVLTLLLLFTLTAFSKHAAPAPGEAPGPVPTAAEPGQAQIPRDAADIPGERWYCEEGDFTLWLFGKYAKATVKQDERYALALETGLGSFMTLSVYEKDSQDLSAMTEHQLESINQRFLEWEARNGNEDLGHGVLRGEDAVWVWAAFTNPDWRDVNQALYRTVRNGQAVELTFTYLSGDNNDQALCETIALSLLGGRHLDASS